MKIVINKCFGGFGVNKKVFKELGFTWDGYGDLENKDFGITSENYYAYRVNPRLIESLEKIGLEKAGRRVAKLKIITIPDNVEWELEDYDGMESIHEKHRIWR